jgi:integrase
LRIVQTFSAGVASTFPTAPSRERGMCALPTYRPILASAVFSGLRLMEVLGLTWADVDFDAALAAIAGV